jgi:hypothetical protein
MNKSRHPHTALRWAPPGKRKRGRLLGTWRRTVEDEWPQRANHGMRQVGWLKTEMAGEDSLKCEYYSKTTTKIGWEK